MTNSIKPLIECMKDYASSGIHEKRLTFDLEVVDVQTCLKNAYTSYRDKIIFNIDDFDLQLRVLNVDKHKHYLKLVYGTFEGYLAYAFHLSYMMYGYRRTKEHLKHGSLFHHINMINRDIAINNTKNTTSQIHDLSVLWGVDLFYHVNMLIEGFKEIYGK